MSELISGKEALIALANDTDVEYFDDKLNEWVYIDMTHHFKRDFRLKQRTITINGIEVPAPFEPRVGEKYWFIADYVSSGYSDTQEGTGINSSIGKWRTEDEIKQVITALRKIFSNT